MFFTASNQPATTQVSIVFLVSMILVHSSPENLWNNQMINFLFVTIVLILQKLPLYRSFYTSVHPCYSCPLFSPVKCPNCCLLSVFQFQDCSLKCLIKLVYCLDCRLIFQAKVIFTWPSCPIQRRFPGLVLERRMGFCRSRYGTPQKSYFTSCENVSQVTSGKNQLYGTFAGTLVILNVFFLNQSRYQCKSNDF